MEDEIKQLSNILYELCKEDCPFGPDHHCFLKDYAIHSNPSKILLYQFKCLERFKKEHDIVISDNEVAKEWISDGYAALFRELFNEEIEFEELYKAIKQRQSEKTSK